MFICLDYLFICLFVIQHRNWPLRSTILNAHGTNASPDGLCTRTHLTKPSRAGFAVSRLELIEPGAETCVYNEARPKERSDRARFLGMPGPFLKSLDNLVVY